VTGDLLTAATAALAVAVELFEALAIVLAVGVSRSWRDAIIGTVAAVAACAVLALLGGGLISQVPIDSLRFVIGALLLLFGLEWLRKGTLRLAGLRARSSARAEYEETLEELAADPAPAAGGADWTARAIAFKGVLLEGVEIVLIVTVIASQPGRTAPALIGAAVAVVATIALGFATRERLAALPETELKWGVGVMLTAFGVFFCGEGLDVAWPGGDAALLYCVAAIALAAELRIRSLHRLALSA
jgi:uncharacterized membrane protein